MAESESAPTPAPIATNGETSALQLDVQKLHTLPSEQQDLYLLQFTSDLTRHVDSLGPDGSSAEQVIIKKELFQIINLASPAPTRVIRNNVGRCFAAIFGKGDRKLLYESINELVAILSAGKEKELRAKLAAVHCLGAIFEAAGDSAVSLSALACTTALKSLKPAQNHVGFRSAIYRALGRIMIGIKAPLDEYIARDAWKQARSAAPGDKALLVQSSACWCLEQLFRTTAYFDNSNDFEKLQTCLWKTIDSPSESVRHTAASCMSVVLVKSYSESPNKEAIPRLKKPKKSKKQAKGEDEEDEIERASSPAPSKPVIALSFSLNEILKSLSSQYFKSTNRARAGIAICYTKTMKSLGERVVEQNYAEIARHLFFDILSHASLQFNRYKQLVSRRYVRVILEDVSGKMLGESAQINAARYLLNNILKDYPQAVKERPEPSKQALIGALSALSCLIQSLGAAIGSIAELCREGLLQVLQHPSYTVQVHASRTLREFVLACPQQLLPTVTICMNSVNRELNQLSGPQRSPRRCVGYANGLAAVLSTSSYHPLYGSLDVYSRVLSQATNLLKSSSSSDLRISSTQLQVAWIMIGGLMSLGPNFVKIHLPQLMLLWKNALPRPLTKDHMTQRTMLELSFLAHVRECALGSVKAFLTFNAKLLTSDVSKRLAALLQNTVMFLTSLPDRKFSEDLLQRLSPSLHLADFDVMVKRRVFQCFSQLMMLSPAGSVEVAMQANILPLAVASFSDPENYAPSSLSVAIASSAGNFESIWEVGDNYGFGVNGLVKGLDLRSLPHEGRQREAHWLSRRDHEATIDGTLRSPICGSLEYDSTVLYLNRNSTNEDLPDPAGTEVVNAAIGIFAWSLPLQSPKVQESVLEQMASFLNSAVAQKDPARKAALVVNISTALLATLKVSIGETGISKGNVQSANVERVFQDFLHAFVCDPDQAVRSIAAQALGRLCSGSGHTLTTTEVLHLTDTIVKNREPHVRAGCALALANIHSQLGGMAAGYHLKTITGILMSLATDPHPIVHFWALEGLALLADSAGLTFSGYVTGSIGMLGQLHVLDSHNSETSSAASSNMSVEFPATAAIARCVDALINVLGPDLQDMTKARDMILTLARQFQLEQDVAISLESLKCMEHLSLYAPGHMEFAAYVRRLQSDLDSLSFEINTAAIAGLFSLMRRDPDEVVRTARPGLEERLWDLLDSQPQQQAIRSIFSNWLQQTGLSATLEWIQRCNTVLTKAKAKIEEPRITTAKETAAPDVQDEEVAGFAVAAGVTREHDGPPATSTQELMRWQVRFFAMEELSSLLSMTSKHAAIYEDSPSEAALQARISDVVRIAFSASTAGVVELRIVGMHILDQVLKMFGRTPDPDFSEAMLLEQYQAQISSALTPAFATDSSPELAAEAVNVCATFIATGIVTDIDRMGRILKLLVSALESFSMDSETAAIGDLKALSSNAQVMVRMAVLSAWADLQIASADQKYLVDVVKPHIATLTPQWLSSLREYARLRFEPDISATTDTSTLSGNLDTIYAALNRETLLKFYQDAWLSLVDAIASLIDEDSKFVFDALDGKADEPKPKGANGADGIVRRSTGINYREEPVAFFFVLFGLAFESLAVRTAEDEVTTSQRNLEILLALKKILRPSVSGNAIYQEVVFAETMDLLDRMVLTEPMSVQKVIVDIARNLCVGHPSSRHGLQSPINGEALSDDIDQLFELTRIIVLVLAGLIPGLSDAPVSTRPEMADEADLVREALEALVAVAEIFPSIIKTDLHASILHIFVTILGTGVCQATIVPQTLPIFRRFLTSLVGDGRTETKEQFRSTLARLLAILKNAQKRDSDASLPCEKNTLLACTLMITTVSADLDTGDPLSNRFITELGECLDSRMTSRVAAGCARSLVLAGLKTDAMLTIQSQLLPMLVFFISEPSNVEGMDGSRTLIAQTLVAFAARAPSESRTSAVALIVPAILSRAAKEGKETHNETATRLLELATIDNAAFRAVVGSLEAGERSSMENVLRDGRPTARDTMSPLNEDREPSIALKMDFGG